MGMTLGQLGDLIEIFNALKREQQAVCPATAHLWDGIEPMDVIAMLRSGSLEPDVASCRLPFPANILWMLTVWFSGLPKDDMPPHELASVRHRVLKYTKLMKEWAEIELASIAGTDS